MRTVAPRALIVAHRRVHETLREFRLLVLVTGEARHLHAAVRLVAGVASSRNRGMDVLLRVPRFRLVGVTLIAERLAFGLQ